MELEVGGNKKLIIEDGLIKSLNKEETFFVHKFDNKIAITDSHEYINSNSVTSFVGNNIQIVNDSIICNGFEIKVTGKTIDITGEDAEIIYNNEKLNACQSSKGKEPYENEFLEYPISSLKQILIKTNGALKVLDSNIINRKLGIKVTGQGDIDIHGNIEDELWDLNTKISGQGNVNIRNLSSENIDAKISGQGSINFITCNANDANLKVSGMGNINYNGSTFENVDKKVSGMGNIS